MAKSMQRAASRMRPDPMTRPRPPSPRPMGTAAGVDGAFAVARTVTHAPPRAVTRQGVIVVWSLMTFVASINGPI